MFYGIQTKTGWINGKGDDNMKDTLRFAKTGEEGYEMKKSRQEIYRYFKEESVQEQYRRAMLKLTAKLRMVDELLKEESGRMIISYITSRIKEPDSIIEKLQRKQKKISVASAKENLNDIAGVRAVCVFMDDIYDIRDFIHKQQDIEVIKEKDFIKKSKPSGYRSLHLILTIDDVKVELQLRTPAMDFWSVLEYQLQYKKKNKKVKAEESELKNCAAAIEEIEERMAQLRYRIEDT